MPGSIGRSYPLHSGRIEGARGLGIRRIAALESQRPLEPRISSVQQRNMVPNRTGSCIGECFNSRETIGSALECVQECAWDCANYNGRARTDFCNDQCKDTFGWAYDPECDNDGLPGGCLFDRYERCRFWCRNGCD